ncbi:metallophosphoesterase [Epibacterium sp. DP7N7-1]|nr:metallophosphoesterase [Epibacterium sp. DP7N7-1]
MTRFLQWSDLHREFAKDGSPVPFPMPTSACSPGSIDAILIAGDLDHAKRHVDSLAEIHEVWKVPVVSIFGNHEPYGMSEQEARDQAATDLLDARQRGLDLHILDRDELVIGDTRILGATLWTDFNILGDQEVMMFGAQHLINDYRKVRSAPGSSECQTPWETLAMHQRDKDWLLEALAKPFEGKTLVMTHHLPVPETLAPEADKGSYAPAYVSDLREDILSLKIDTWVSGHTHYARRGLLEGLHGQIAFTANMSGYVRDGKRQETNFEPYRVIDMDRPTLGLDPIDIAEPGLQDLPHALMVLEQLRDEPAPAI